jgi:hypothetical protein
MRIKLALLLLTLVLCIGLYGQNTLSINGLNEAQFIYRTAEDSLNAYFRDSFAFNLDYRNFSFGMKYIAELPKYSTQQQELIDNLDPNKLQLGWQELYAAYSKDAFSIHAGTTEESFGNGLVFRSYHDLEFDEDNRINGFLFKYDNEFIVKALYGAIESPDYASKYDLVYGADFVTPFAYGVRLGASALSMRNLGAMNNYTQRDVFSGRMQFSWNMLDVYGEFAGSESYKQPGLPTTLGKAIYANADFNLGAIQLGGAYKMYDDFQYRLHDLAMANYHSETISDALASGVDEEGWQIRSTISLGEYTSLYVDYAEAWDSPKLKQMNDLYAAMDWTLGSLLLETAYSHVEKVDDASSYWQKEATPALNLGFPVLGKQVQIKSEFKMAEKQTFAVVAEHYEPKLQLDTSIGKLSLSAAVQSNWKDFDAVMDSRYWAAVEVKYPIASHSDIVLFGGKEAGGKICRNGVCRYVSAFQGIKAELSTRF